MPAGTQVGRYVLGDVLGKGAIGVVYRARDPELERDIAVKMMRYISDKRRERGLREAQALAQLSRHRNVITVYDVGLYDDDYVFIAMELVEGDTLQSWLDRGTRSREQIIDVFVQAGQGLKAAHDAGMVHRDFKPENVLVDSDGRAMVLDFGLARALDVSGDSLDFGDDEPEHLKLGAGPDAGDDLPDALTAPRENRDESRPSGRFLLAKTMTRAGEIVGTPAYMPPEQLLGAATGTHADQFSFCVAAYEALHGDRPFAAKGSNFITLRKAVLAGRVRPAPPDSRVPARLRRVLLRGLMRSPVDRYPSMDELLHDLAPFARSRSKRLAVMAAVGVAAVLLVAVMSWAMTRPDPAAVACQDSDALWTEVWNPGLRDAGEERFVATGRRHAAETWSRIAGILERRGSRWVATRREVCLRTRVHASQSHRLLDVRMSCLDSRLRETRAFIAALTTAPDASTVDQALQASAELSYIDSCSTLEDVAMPLPDSPARRQAIAEVADQLHRVEALIRVGRLEQALPIAERAVKEAESSGYPPLRARAGLLHGRLLEKPKTDLTGAEETLLAAANHAAEARDDALLAEIYLWLMRVLVSSKAELGEVARFGELAETAITRAGNPAKLRGQLCENRAILFVTRGKSRESHAEYDCAIDAYAEAGGPHDAKIGSVLTFQGFSLMLEGKLDLAWQRLERAQEIIDATVGARHPWRARGLAAMATLAYHRDYQEKAGAWATEALDVYKEVYGEDSSSVASLRRILARVDLARGRVAEARIRADEAWKFMTRHFGESGANVNPYLSLMGDVALAEGDHAGAIERYRGALETARKIYGANHPLVVRTLLKLARAHRRAGEPARADEHVEASLAAIQAAGRDDHPIYVDSLNAVATMRLARGDVAGARQAVDKALAYAYRDRLSDGAWGESHALLAEISWRDPERRSEALAAAERALALFSSAESASFHDRRAQLETWLAERTPAK